MADDTEEKTEEIEEESVEAAEQTEAEAVPEKKEKKQKKVVRRRKSKKEKERPLTGALRLAVESGKVEFGARTATGSKARLFVLAANTPQAVREKVSSYAKASEIPIIEFEGTSIELGSVCGKPFPVSVLSVHEEGSSNILELAKKK